MNLISDFAVPSALQDIYVVPGRTDGDVYFNIKICSEVAANALEVVINTQSSQLILKTIQSITDTPKTFQVVDVVVCNLAPVCISLLRRTLKGIIASVTNHNPRVYVAM